MFTRRELLLGTTAFAAMAALPLSFADMAQAQGAAPPVDLLKIFVPAAPGGGWDQTGRTIEQVLRATGAVKGVQITNVAGAGGAVGSPGIACMRRLCERLGEATPSELAIVVAPATPSMAVPANLAAAAEALAMGTGKVGERTRLLREPATTCVGWCTR